MSEQKAQGRFQYGGQAVIEGVMMRGPQDIATAVRVGDEIVIHQEECKSWSDSFSMLKWPFVRGTFVLIESMVVGMKALNYSASLMADEEEGEALSAWEMGLTMVIALLISIVLFIIIPTWVGHMALGLESVWAQNTVEGVTRVVIFLGYVLGIRAMDDIKRVFQYHGAEHKVINTYEDGAELTVDEVKKRSRLHPSCGTSFLLIVVLLSILVFAFLGNGSWLWKFGSRILLLPVVAGLGYEFLRLSRKYTEQMRFLIAPGLWLQGLTTGEPDAEQIEVAIAAFEHVLAAPTGDMAAMEN